jgi:hypothetical protein
VSNNGGRPFNGSNNKPPRGCTNGSLGGGDNGHPAYQIPRSYVARPIGLWIRPTWNLWYTSWYHVYPPIAPNPPRSTKSLPYPIYIARTNPYVHVLLFCKAIQANEEKNDVNIVNLNFFALAMPYLNGERILCKPILFADLKS